MGVGRMLQPTPGRDGSRPMNHWIDAIYDVTGIPLSDGDLGLALRGGREWLMLHRQPVMPLPERAAFHGRRRPTQTRRPKCARAA